MHRKLTGIALLAAIFAGSLTLVSNTAYAQDPRVEAYLYGIRQNLALAISNAESLCQLPDDSGITCNGAVYNVCQTALISSAALQDLIIQGVLSPENSTYLYVEQVRSGSCSSSF